MYLWLADAVGAQARGRDVLSARGKGSDDHEPSSRVRRTGLAQDRLCTALPARHSWNVRKSPDSDSNLYAQPMIPRI